MQTPSRTEQHPDWTEQRPAAVAGRFYPAQPVTLQATLDELLQAATPPPTAEPGKLRALIVPHAAYLYSGPVAATAYALLRAIAHRVRRVLLLGPSHRHYHPGLALAPTRYHVTPLGKIATDLEFAEALLQLPQVCCSSAAHAQEHSLEVQLPFLQHLLPDFRLLALTVGECDAEQVAEVIGSAATSPENLVLVSSDLSHYHDYDTARALDAETAAAIVARLPEALNTERACGGRAIRGLLHYARRHGLQGSLLDLRNSGDTAGDKQRVVGYGTFAFHAA